MAKTQGSTSKAEAGKGSKRLLPAATTVEGLRMTCVQCGRERSVAVARSSKFCTQRCIINWMEAHPGLTPRDAVGDEVTPTSAESPSSSDSPSSSSKTTPPKLPRALKNLQIDMAKPGTKLTPPTSSPSSDEEDSKEKRPRPPALVAGGGSPTVGQILGGGGFSLLQSLASIMSNQQKPAPPTTTTIGATPISAPTQTGTPTASAPSSSGGLPDKPEKNLRPQGGKVDSDTPSSKLQSGEAGKPPGHAPKMSATKGAKRSAAVTLQGSSAKKQKLGGGKGTQSLSSTSSSSSSSQAKSVSFNLNPAEVVAESNPVPITLDKIASYLQPRKPPTLEIKIPPGQSVSRITQSMCPLCL